MIGLDGVFFMQLLMGGLMIFFLQKQIKMKKQLDEMTRQVSDYIAYLTQDIGDEAQEEKTEGLYQEQSHLIQTILQEYFP